MQSLLPVSPSPVSIPMWAPSFLPLTAVQPLVHVVRNMASTCPRFYNSSHVRETGLASFVPNPKIPSKTLTVGPVNYGQEIRVVHFEPLCASSCLLPRANIY